MPSQEQHLRQIVGAHVADLMVKYAVACGERDAAQDYAQKVSEENEQLKAQIANRVTPRRRTRRTERPADA